MTRVTKPISRVTSSLIRERGKNREIVVHIEPRRIGFRAKGCKRIYWLTADSCYVLAVRAKVRDDKKQKAKEKKERKKLRRKK